MRNSPRPRLAGLLLLAGLALSGCTAASEPAAPIRVSRTPAGDRVRLTLLPATGYRINARLPPALELADGTVLRFESSRLTADSAYFAAPPFVLVAGQDSELRGTIRASVCGSDPVCRAVELDL